MSVAATKSISGTVILLLLGIAALFAGEKWLVALIPAALLVWYGARPLRTGRN
jgi:multisubunit Na+/H+ antiporter MnhG subunit